MKKTLSLLLCALLMLSLAVPAFAENDAAPTVYKALFHGGSPSGIADVGDGSYLITDIYNKVIWQMVPGDEPVILVGRIAVYDQSGEPVGGYNDSDFENSAFSLPWDITPFLDGYLVSDTTNHVIRFIGDDRVQTAFGSGKAGYNDGRGLAALLNSPTGLTTDENGNAYVADTGNNVIRKMSPNGQVTTFAGSSAAGCVNGAALSASFNGPTGLYWHDGALYVADTGNHVIRKIDNGQVTTVAGTVFTKNDGDSLLGGAYQDGDVSDACFSSPTGVAISKDGVLYVSDSGNSAIREIKDGKVITTIKSNADRGDPYPVSPRGLTFAGETLLIADVFAGVVFTPDASGFVAFEDVPAGEWFSAAIYSGARAGLFKGMSETEFSPYTTLSRGMLMTVIGRMEGVDAEKFKEQPFSDVGANAYYAPYIAWAFENGLAEGRSVSNGVPYFEPESPITREEIVTLLYRYARLCGMTSSYHSNLSSFSDAGSASDWSLEAWQWAVAAGVISGYDDGTLRPGASANRAEMAVMINSFSEFLTK